MVAQVPVLDPEKLIKARGRRTRLEIVRAGGEKFSEQQLYAYENGLYRPKPETLPYLLDALGVDYEEVSSPVSVELEATGTTARAR